MRFRQITEGVAESRLAPHAGLTQFVKKFVVNDEAGIYRPGPMRAYEAEAAAWSRVPNPTSRWLYTRGRMAIYFADDATATAFKIRWV
ncbi:hypothetical protein [Methylobacterium sp. P5_C11]